MAGTCSKLEVEHQPARATVTGMQLVSVQVLPWRTAPGSEGVGRDRERDGEGEAGREEGRERGKGLERHINMCRCVYMCIHVYESV